MPRLVLALCVILAAMLIIASPALTQTKAQPKAAADAPAAQPELWELMESMAEHLAKAKQELGKEGGLPAAADHAHAMQVLAVQCKVLTPPMIAELEPGAKRDELAAGYRRAMIALTQRMIALEIAILDENTEEAGKLIDMLIDDRFQGHLKYKET